jgi:hypothetical protein
MPRTKNTPAARPDPARSAAHDAPPSAPAQGARPAPGGPAAAVLAALTACPGGATTAGIAAAAGISRAAARDALTALETAGTVTRTKGGKPGVPDTWHPTASEPIVAATTHQTASDPAATKPAGQQPGGGPGQHTSAADQENGGSQTETAAMAKDGAAGGGDASADDSGHDDPALAIAEPEHPERESAGGARHGEDATAATGDAPAGDGQAPPDPAVQAEVGEQAGQIGVAAQAVATAVTAGDLRAALAGIEEICEQATRARRTLKTAVGGKKTPGARPGGLREKVAAHLRAHPDASFTPHEIHKVLGNSSGAIANALDTLAGLGQAELACEKPRRFRHAATAPAAAADDAGQEQELAGAA